MRCDRLLMLAVALLGIVLSLVAGCDAGTCTRHSDCATGFICAANGRCAVAPTESTPADVDGGDGDGGANPGDASTP